MKSLYESILSVNNVGLDGMIRTWLEENGIISGGYTIKNHIIYPNDGADVQLFPRGGDMEELPEYIQFADGDYNLLFGFFSNFNRNSNVDDTKDVKSFRGLPSKVRSFSLNSPPKTARWPELNLKVTQFFSLGYVNPSNKINIEHVDGKKIIPGPDARVEHSPNLIFDLRIMYNTNHNSNIKLKGFGVINIYDDEGLSEIRSICKSEKTVMNKDKWETPVSKKVSKFIDKFIKEQYELKLEDEYYCLICDDFYLIKNINGDNKWYQFDQNEF